MLFCAWGSPASSCYAARIELELTRVDDEVDSLEVRQLLQLRRRPLGLYRTPAHDEVDVPDPAGAQARQGVVGDVGRRQILGIAPENPRHIDGDVAGADDRGRLHLKVYRQVEKIGVGAVPGDERRRRMAAAEILARHTEPPVALAADGEDDLIVVRREVGDREIAAQLDTAQEAHARVERNALEHPHDLLDLRMVRSDAETHQTVGRRQAIEDVDLKAAHAGTGLAGALR